MTAAADCAATIDFDGAQAILARHIASLEAEKVPLRDAGGRRLAEPVVARIDAPRRDCAAMDGYAVRDVDLAAGLRELRVAGVSHAGESCDAILGEGEAWRVMTGAPVPKASDRVIMVEYCRTNGEHVILEAESISKPHIRRRASDFAAGTVVLAAGQILDTPKLVAAAAADCGSVTVVRRPRIHILATGDEIVAPGTALDDLRAVPDSLAAALAWMCRQWGGEVCDEAHVEDDRAKIARYCAAAQGAAADIIVIAGGAARGDRDFGRSALALLGLETGFADVAMRPGKPLWYGRIGAVHIMGLPGTTTAALTVARLFLAPLVAGLSGADPGSALSWRQLPLAHDVPPAGMREAFLCGFERDGGVCVIERQEASAQAMLAQATLLVRRASEEGGLGAGLCVPILPF